MEYDIGRFDVLCCTKVTFADSWVGVRLPGEVYPEEYTGSLCNRMEESIRKLHCSEEGILPLLKTPLPAESSQPTVSPTPVSTGNNEIKSSDGNDHWLISLSKSNKLGEGLIFALCSFLLIFAARSVVRLDENPI